MGISRERADPGRGWGSPSRVMTSSDGEHRAVPLLSCRGLAKAYGETVAVDDLDFDALAGEVHALVGENGAGKSTFIKMLAASVRPDRGTISVDGEPLTPTSPAAAMRQGVGVVFQELSLAPDLTVAQNLWLLDHRASTLRVLRRSTLRRMTFELFEQLSCGPIDPDRKIRELALSDRQVVEIARALARRPRILVLDEATSSLPASETEWLIETARRLAAEGTLVIYISHRLKEVREVADRVTVLRSGRTVLSSQVGEISDDRLIEAMLGRKPRRLYPPPIRPPSADVACRLEEVSVGSSAVDGVSFELRQGEVLGIGGLQGHGQSELLLGLFGVLPVHGRIEVGGRTVRIRSPRAALRAGFGLALVPEDRKREGLLLDKTLRQNVSLAVLPQVSSWGVLQNAAEDRLARDSMDRLNVRADGPQQRVDTLSGGNQQKIVIAKLLAVGARILLFHDLTRGVDVGTKAEIFSLTRELAADGYSVLMYSSDNEELIHMCDRLLVLREGRIAAELVGDALSAEAIMQAAMGAG
jgi:ribose transport system ATP-binding protein